MSVIAGRGLGMGDQGEKTLTEREMDLVAVRKEGINETYKGQSVSCFSHLVVL